MAVSAALAHREENPAPSVQSETAAVLSMIERAARDETVNVDKLKQLMEMRDKVAAQHAERAFDAAMTDAQSDMQPVAADSNNPQTRSRYASYHALDKALRPIYTKHGFALSFGTGEGAGEQMVRVTCRVSHREGHSRNYQIDMPADGKGAKGGDVMTRTHATGSAVSYGMRYLLKMIFNIAVGDDDGNSAGEGDKISEDQVAQLRSLIVETGADIPKFCTYMKVNRVEEIPAKNFATAKTALEKKRKPSS